MISYEIDDAWLLPRRSSEALKKVFYEEFQDLKLLKKQVMMLLVAQATILLGIQAIMVLGI